MAVGTVSFALDAPDEAVNPQAQAADAQDAAAGDKTAVPGAQVTMGGVLPPPRVSYSPNPGTYTQLWIQEFNQPSLAELQSLASGTRKTVLQPVDDDNDKKDSKVSV